MSICAHRPEETSFWTPCRMCLCAAEVKAELEADRPDPEEAA